MSDPHRARQDFPEYGPIERFEDPFATEEPESWDDREDFADELDEEDFSGEGMQAFAEEEDVDAFAEESPGDPFADDQRFVIAESPREYELGYGVEAEAALLFEGESSRAVYEAKVREGVTRLRPSAGANGFGIPFVSNTFNTDDWVKRPDTVMRSARGGGGWMMLVLKNGKSPVAAIERIMTQGNKWTLECAMFVQVVQLYALSKVNPAVYDQTWKNKGLQLRFFNSSGVKRRYFFDKERKTHPWRAWFKKNGQCGRQDLSTPWTDQRVLTKMPIGSRVMWRNNLIPARIPDPDRPGSFRTDAFRNENAVKVGNNSYRAFPLGSGPISEQQLKLRMANARMAAFPDPGASSALEYANRNIFLSEAVSFKLSGAANRCPPG